MGHGDVQTLHQDRHALKNSECHCGIINLRLNVTNFPSHVAIKGSWGTVVEESGMNKALVLGVLGRKGVALRLTAALGVGFGFGAPGTHTLRFRVQPRMGPKD